MNVLKVVKFSRTWVAALALVAGGASAAMLPQQSTEEIKDRIAPVAKVRVAGASETAANTGAAGARSGDAIYNRYCLACHAAGVLGAPKLNDAADWEPRLAQGMDVVLKHAIDGFNAMPPRGTCMDCSDEEMQAAIDYMISDL